MKHITAQENDDYRKKTFVEFFTRNNLTDYYTQYEDKIILNTLSTSLKP